MYDAVMTHANLSQVIIMAAAVSDFRPVHKIDHKVKKRKRRQLFSLSALTIFC